MLPAGHDLAVELVNGGEIAPEISRIVKSHVNPEPEIGDMETETVSVWDKDGNEYAIPIDVLATYRI